MSPEAHAAIGVLVLAVNLGVGAWALVAGRRTAAPSTALSAAVLVAMALLGLQILIGMDLWARGGRPADGFLSVVHVLGPILALVVGLVVIFGTPIVKTRAYAAATLLAAIAALVSYGIAEAA